MEKKNLQIIREFGERGVAMLECCIILPLLVVMVIATYDLGGALNEYLMLTRASYEGARYAAVIPGFEKSATPNTKFTKSSATDSYDGAGNHAKVRDRVRKVLELSGFSTTDIEIVTTNSNDETVSVQVNKRYQGHFGIFPDITLRVSATGPFLSKPPV